MSAATLVGIIAFCSLWTCGSLLRCWKCYGSTYEECQQNLALSNCASESSCFQLNVNFSNANESVILFSKGCLATSNCDDYRRGNAGFCQSERAGGSNGTCFGECCDGEGCNKGDLLALSTTATASSPTTLTASNPTTTQTASNPTTTQTASNPTTTLTASNPTTTLTASNPTTTQTASNPTTTLTASNPTTTQTASNPTTTQTASNPTTTNKGTVVIISVMVLLSGLVLTVVNIG